MDNSFKRNYWKQVDLHCHTRGGVTFDGKSDNASYSHSLFVDFLKMCGTQVQAVTNHNTFVVSDHVKQAIIAESIGVAYIPGVEIDCYLDNPSNSFHTLFLFDPQNDLVSFSSCLNRKTNDLKSAGAVCYKIDELDRLFSGLHYIFIPHATKKKGLTESKDITEANKDNIYWVFQAIKNATASPVLFENSRPPHSFYLENAFRKLSSDSRFVELANHQVTASDFKFDSDEKRKNEWENRPKYAMFAEPTFLGLELSIRHYSQRFSSVDEITIPTAFIESIRFKRVFDQHFNLDGEIKLSPCLNVIIGNSGSGKTLLLNEIFRTVTGQDLSAVSTDKENSDKNKPAYFSKTKNRRLIEVHNYQNHNISVVEVDKIYQQLLKATNKSEVAELFGINHFDRALSILNDYESNVMKFNESLHDSLLSKDNGNSHLQSIHNSIIFLSQNKGEDRLFQVETFPYDDKPLKDLSSQLNKISALLDKRAEIEKWNNDVYSFLGESVKEQHDAFLKSVAEIATHLQNRKNKIVNDISRENANKLLVGHINTEITKVISLLGDKKRKIAETKEILLNSSNGLRDSVIECIKHECLMNEINLSFPFDEIKNAVFNDDNSKNEFARIVADYKETDKKLAINTGLSEHSLFSFSGNLIKMRRINREYDMSNSQNVKELIVDLRMNGVMFLEILKKEIPYKAQLFDNKQWKDIDSINPGNLAKRYMEYYFNKTIRYSKPNVIFIDQPENDVDKTFISNTLAAFIANNKSEKQFIITSHEPILAVNADANRIIEASLDDAGRISYHSYALESPVKDVGGENGAISVANILDGGKRNVIERNQIYGGSIDD